MIVLGLSSLGHPQNAFEAIRPLAAALNGDTISTAQAILDKAATVIAENVRQVLNEINNKPVYTIHELLTGKIIEPQSVCFIGGPAAAIAASVASRLDLPYLIPEHCKSSQCPGCCPGQNNN